MRMRKKANLEPRMAACADWQVTDPAALKGNWRSRKPDCAALWVELGCGKGKFTVETAAPTRRCCSSPWSAAGRPWSWPWRRPRPWV